MSTARLEFGKAVDVEASRDRMRPSAMKSVKSFGQNNASEEKLTGSNSSTETIGALRLKLCGARPLDKR
jgi:hypothetical protein